MLFSTIGFILLLLTLFYVLAVLWMFIGLFRIPKGKNSSQPGVSVVVAARNESENIDLLLTALTAQTYPADKYEIILVDDESTDDTAERVRQYQNSHRNIRLLRTQNRAQVVSPKKAALHLGITHARGEIILLTDADCVPPPKWIAGMVRYFEPDVGMVIGFSPYELPDLRKIRHRLFALDSLALAAVAAGTCGWGRPATCSGRNLAYRKKVFQQVDGFSRIRQFVSGDDDLFLHLVATETDWKIRYAYEPALVVPTKILASLAHFFHQRIRHASKGFHYGWKETSILAGLYLYNVLLFITVPLALLYPITFWLPLAAYAAKSAIELFFLYTFAARMQRRHFLRVFPLAAVLHIPYVVIFGALGQVLTFNWKDTQYSKKEKKSIAE